MVRLSKNYGSLSVVNLLKIGPNRRHGLGTIQKKIATGNNTLSNKMIVNNNVFVVVMLSWVHSKVHCINIVKTNNDRAW